MLRVLLPAHSAAVRALTAAACFALPACLLPPPGRYGIIRPAGRGLRTIRKRGEEFSVKTKRILMSALGVVICGISVGMFKHAALGVDPFQSLMSGLDAVIPIRFGTLYVIVNLILLLFALVFDRRKIGLATLINLFLLGYIAEFSQACCRSAFPDMSLPGRLALLTAAIVIMCLASAFYFTADLGVSTYDAVSLI